MAAPAGKSHGSCSSRAGTHALENLGGAGLPASYHRVKCSFYPPRMRLRLFCHPGAHHCSSHLHSWNREMPVLLPLKPLCVCREQCLTAKGANEAQLCAETFIVLRCSRQNPSIYFPSVGAGSDCIHLHELIIHLIIFMPSQWGMKAINKSHHCCRLY